MIELVEPSGRPKQPFTHPPAWRPERSGSRPAGRQWRAGSESGRWRAAKSAGHLGAGLLPLGVTQRAIAILVESGQWWGDEAGRWCHLPAGKTGPSRPRRTPGAGHRGERVPGQDVSRPKREHPHDKRDTYPVPPLRQIASRPVLSQHHPAEEPRDEKKRGIRKLCSQSWKYRAAPPPPGPMKPGGEPSMNIRKSRA